jgi:hypothetical protein
MKLKALSLAVMLALAGAVSAQTDAPKDGQKPRPALNLRLDDGSSAAPRINFDQPASAQTKEEREKGLPDLGGKPSTAFDRAVSSGINSSSPNTSVIPSAMDPAVNRQ